MENGSRGIANSTYATVKGLLAGKESSSQSRAVSADLPVTKELGYCLKGARFFPLQGMNQLPVTSTVLTSPVAPNPLLPV